MIGRKLAARPSQSGMLRGKPIAALDLYDIV